MITITQGINDYYDKMRDVGRYLLENAEFVGLLKQKTESIAAFRNNGRIVLSEMEYRLLSSVTKTTEYSEIFMITPFGRGICRLTVPRETQLLFTTNPDELSMIDETLDGVPGSSSGLTVHHDTVEPHPRLPAQS